MNFSNLPPEEQLDFWLGHWRVTDPSGATGSNHITRIMDGKVTQENFKFGESFVGMSVSVYNSRLNRWEQTWVDNGGNYWAFSGGAEGEQFILGCDDVRKGQPVKLRMIFYNIKADSLDWSWESSADQGQTWEQKWHLHYERLAAEKS